MGFTLLTKLEEKLQQNFTSSIEGRVKSLEYLIREAMKSDNNTNEDMSSKIHKILSDNETNDIEEIRLIDSNGVILGTSDSSNQSVTGQRVTDINIKRALVSGKNGIGDLLIKLVKGFGY